MTVSVPCVRVKSVAFQLGAATLIDDATWTAPAGTMTGLIGPNGSGKTTLLSLIARWARPSRGEITLDDQSATAYSRREYARLVATVEQHSATDLGLTVQQIVELGTIPYTALPGRSRTQEADIDEPMHALRVDHLRHRFWQTLSGGERQRTQVARALAQRPQVLLLDEPVNHLDPAAALDLLALISECGLTTIAALHDLSLAAMYCDHLVVLNHGRVVAHGPPTKVLTPRLLADVYGLDAEVTTHPRTGRPMVIACGTIEQEVS